jgi:hypothetical protein
MSLVLRKSSPNITRHRLKKEYKNLLMSIQALPGINIISTNLDKPFEKIVDGWNGVHIFFTVREDNNEGLFFLGRCLNKRYWEHGNKWRIELEVSDEPYPNQMRPIVYSLYRPIDKNSIPPTMESDIIEECESLISCMNSHYKHEIFMTNYNMSKDVYHLEDEVAWDRGEKLNNLGII